MNDFTLKELYCLENAIDLQLKEKPMNELNFEKRLELRDKLKDMIENYCDHREQVIVDLNCGAYVCKDCEKILGEE